MITVHANEAQHWQKCLDGCTLYHKRLSAYISNKSKNDYQNNRQNNQKYHNNFNQNNNYKKYNNYQNNNQNNNYKKYNNYQNNNQRYKKKSRFNNSNQQYRSGRNNKYAKTFNQSLNQSQKEQINNLLQKRYSNSSSNMLNLSNIISDENENWASFSNHSFVVELLHIIKNNCTHVQSIDLSNNSISTLLTLQKLYKSAPMLENLSLLDNPILSFDELNHLHSYGDKLRELYLRNSNLMNEVSNISQLYIYEIIRRFKVLRLLDGEFIPYSFISFGSKINEFQNYVQSNASQTPVTCHQVSEISIDIVHNFIRNFYEIFDCSNFRNREKLLDFYHSDACFSLTYCLMDTPMVNQKSETFQLYRKNIQYSNRNLLDSYYQMRYRSQQCSNVVHERLNIIQFFVEKMPFTEHQLPFMCIDCHPFNLCLTEMTADFMQVSMVGYYAQKDECCRKFQRTFLLAANGNNISIINDQVLFLKCFCVLYFICM